MPIPELNVFNDGDVIEALLVNQNFSDIADFLNTIEDNTLDASNIVTGTLADARLSTNVTKQGNTFNGNSELVQTNSSGAIPVAVLNQNVGLVNYDSTFSYQIGYLAKDPNSGKVYESLVVNNIGNALTNITYWKMVFDFSSITPTPISVLINTPYLAASNGFLNIRWQWACPSGNSDNYMYVYSDTSATPTTNIFSWGDGYQGGDITRGERQIDVRIYAGNYYKVVPGLNGNVDSYFIGATFTPANF